jgi:hypothetical protein
LPVLSETPIHPLAERDSHGEPCNHRRNSWLGDLY